MKYLFSLGLLFSFLHVSQLFAQSAASDSLALAPKIEIEQQSLFEYLGDSSTIDLEIHTDLTPILTKAKGGKYVKGVLKEMRADSIVEWDIRLRLRGKTRRRVCDFPPLKLKFYDSDLATKGLLPFDDLKLVTHCKDNEEAEATLMKEYAAYKIYNEICPASFRVQLARITYVDTEGQYEPITKLAFLIENKKEMAARLNGKVKNKYGYARDSLDEKQFVTLNLFQYLIGNTDWAVPIKHNLVLMDPKGSCKAYAIPYDFDFSGLVNASYALPNPNLSQQKVTDRVYMSYSVSDAILNEVIQHFKDVRSNIMEICHNAPELSKEDKLYMLSYLEGFYKEIKKPAKFKKKVINRSVDHNFKI